MASDRLPLVFCFICSDGFDSVIEVCRHLDEHHPGVFHVCLGCVHRTGHLTAFTTTGAFERHLQLVHPGNEGLASREMVMDTDEEPPLQNSIWGPWESCDDQEGTPIPALLASPIGVTAGPTDGQQSAVGSALAGGTDSAGDLSLDLAPADTTSGDGPCGVEPEVGLTELPADAGDISVEKPSVDSTCGSPPAELVFQHEEETAPPPAPLSVGHTENSMEKTLSDELGMRASPGTLSSCALDGTSDQVTQENPTPASPDSPVASSVCVSGPVPDHPMKDSQAFESRGSSASLLVPHTDRNDCSNTSVLQGAPSLELPGLPSSPHAGSIDASEPFSGYPVQNVPSLESFVPPASPVEPSIDADEPVQGHPLEEYSSDPMVGVLSSPVALSSMNADEFVPDHPMAENPALQSPLLPSTQDAFPDNAGESSSENLAQSIQSIGSLGSPSAAFAPSIHDRDGILGYTVPPLESLVGPSAPMGASFVAGNQTPDDHMEEDLAELLVFPSSQPSDESPPSGLVSKERPLVHDGGQPGRDRHLEVTEIQVIDFGRPFASVGSVASVGGLGINEVEFAVQNARPSTSGIGRVTALRLEAGTSAAAGTLSTGEDIVADSRDPNLDGAAASPPMDIGTPPDPGEQDDGSEVHFNCGVCSRRFKSHRGLQIHKGKIHGTSKKGIGKKD